MATTRRFSFPSALSAATRALAVGLVLLAVALPVAGCGSSDDSARQSERRTAARLLRHEQARRRALERELAAARQAHRRRKLRGTRRAAAHPATADGPPLGAGATRSFETLAGSTAGRIGLALTSLGGGETESLGSLRTGHAWSSIKVPILVALMRDRHEDLSPKEEERAAAAVEASDNEAAASLFRRLEDIHGGLEGASAAVRETMAMAGNSTTVATAPPPPGAVSTYGQTEWSIEEATAFYRALASGCLLGASGTEYVLGLMRNVIPEQRWGLGDAAFGPSRSVGFKGGWGPEAESGAYLVRQSGLIQSGNRGVAVTMIAEEASGSFEAGVSDLNRMAAWLAENLRGLGPAGRHC